MTFDKVPNFDWNAVAASETGSAAPQIPPQRTEVRLEMLLQLLYEKVGRSWKVAAAKIPRDRTTVYRWAEGKSKPRHYDLMCERVEHIIRECGAPTIDSPSITIHIDPHDEQPASVKSMQSLLRLAGEFRAAGLNVYADGLLNTTIQCAHILAESLKGDGPRLLACVASAHSMMDQLDDAISNFEKASSAAASAGDDRQAYRYKISVEYLKADKSWRAHRTSNDLKPEYKMIVDVTACLDAVKLEVMPSPTDLGMKLQLDGTMIAFLSMLNARNRFIEHVRDMINRGVSQRFDGLAEAKKACSANQHGMYDNALRWLRAEFS